MRPRGETRLQPPDAAVRPQPRRAYAFLWLAAALLIALAASVVFVLPKLVQQPGDSTDVETPVIVRDSAENRPDGAQNSARRDAEMELQRYLKLRARLELARGDRWGEPEWSESGALVGSGDALFGRSDYAAAKRAYASAADLLTGLDQSRESRLDAALRNGDAALEADRSLEAETAYTMALAIDPENAAAIKGLSRAAVRDAVLVHVAAGRRAERRDELAEARAQYDAALALDAEHSAAADGRARAVAAINKRTFESAMTAALAALEDGRLSDARQALDVAAEADSGAPALRDAQRRLAQLILQRDVSACRSRAAAYETAENWDAAIDQYQKALALAPASGFADEGLQRARARKELNEQVRFYLADPERLYSADRLAHARSLVTEASALTGSEPLLGASLRRLVVLIDEASRPLDITIRSDGFTRVVIHHVGRLGRFDEQRVELLPGRYTIVGERDGFRDVRQVIEIRPGDNPINLDVRCEEPI